jgi:hypothetical protein
LPLVIAVRGKFQDSGVWPQLAEDVKCNPVDLCIALAAPLIGQWASVSNTGEHEAMLDPRNPGFVHGQPGNCPNSAGDEEESI